MRMHFISTPRELPAQLVAQGGVRGALLTLSFEGRPLIAARKRKRSHTNKIDENQIQTQP